VAWPRALLRPHVADSRRALRSIIFIFKIALIAPGAFPGSAMSSCTSLGTTCQDTPNLSFSQPHCCAFSS